MRDVGKKFLPHLFESFKARDVYENSQGSFRRSLMTFAVRAA